MKHVKLFEGFCHEIYQGIYINTILNEDFNSQRIKYISQGYSEKIVDRYLKDFREMRDKKFKEASNAQINGLNVEQGESRFNIDNYKTFREVELIVDYVAGQRNFGSANFEDIEVNGDPIFKNSEVEIYYADSPRACIQYKGNKPYSWCIARSTGNMFYNYRLGQLEPSFYFVKRIKATEKEFSFWNLGKSIFAGEFRDKWHFFVLQVLNSPENKKYLITSTMNDGDNEATWKQVLKIAPELEGLQSLIAPKPLTRIERKKIEKYQEGISDEEFIKLPFKEKKYYLSIYVNMDNRLNDFQFDNLPEELKNDYITYGVGLSQHQFESIKSDSKMVKRYIGVTKKKYDTIKKAFQSDVNFTKNELKIIYENIIKGRGESEILEILERLFPDGGIETINYGEDEILAIFLIVDSNDNQELKKINLLYQVKSFPVVKEMIEEFLKHDNLEILKTLLNYINQHTLSGFKLPKDSQEYLEKIKDGIVNRLTDVIGSLDPKKMTYHLINDLINASENGEELLQKLLTPRILKSVPLLSFFTFGNPRYKEYNNLAVNLIVSNRDLLNLIKSSDVRILQQYSNDPDGVIQRINQTRPELLNP